MKKRIIEIAVKMIVAALTAFLTAITTTSCMGYGPIAFWEKKSHSLIPMDWQHQQVLSVFFWPEVCNISIIICNFAHENENDIEQTGKHHILGAARTRSALPLGSSKNMLAWLVESWRESTFVKYGCKYTKKGELWVPLPFELIVFVK